MAGMHRICLEGDGPEEACVDTDRMAVQVDNPIEIAKLLKEIADQKPPKITLDLRELRFLNSSGINMFFKFVIRVRDYKVSQLVIQGMKQIFWQNKLLANFQRLMPEVTVEME